MDGNFIRTWESITKVEKELKIYNINAVCKGKQETAGGYKWEYKIKENEYIRFRLSKSLKRYFREWC